MADKPIIKINIDAEEFDRFADRFNKYRESLETLPAEWADQNAEIEELVDGMDALGKSFEKIQKAAQNPTANKASRETSKRTKEDEKSWAKIDKHVGSVNKQMSGLARMSIGIASGGRLGSLAGGGIAGAFAALYGAVTSAANGLASRNMENRSLNLAPGVATAYGKVFQKVGGSSEQLTRFETAKMNPDQWQGLIAAGLSQQEIQSDDAETIAEKFMQRGSQKFLQMPEAVRGTYMRQTGMSNFASETDMNLASSYTPEQWEKMHADFITQRDKVADNPDDLEAGTNLKTHLSENWDQIAKAFDHAAITLAPQLEAWSDAATKLSVTLLASIPGAVKNVEKIVGDAADNLDKSGPIGHINHDPNKPTPGPIKDVQDWWNDAQSADTAHMPGFERIRNWFNSAHPFGTFGHHTPPDPTGGAAGVDDRHNPGNLRPPGDGNSFQTFNTDAEGVRAADRQLQIYNQRDHINTIADAIAKWAPSKDHNDPTKYADFVAGRMGVKAGDQLDFTDPKIRAQIESAMFQYESAHHRDLTPEKVLAMYDPSYKDPEPKKDEAKKDDQKKAVKQASGDAQDMTIYAEDDPALAAHAETQKVLKKIATQKIDPQIIQIDDDGKDSKMPPILQRPPGMGQFPANQNINVKVTAPAGSSVAVTSSNFPG